jgi:predicted nucleic acid-binding protein
MSRSIVFADTFYWIALIDVRDEWNSRVRAGSRALRAAELVTTEAVLVEVLNAFAARHALLRQAAAVQVQRILANPQTEVVSETHDDFMAGFALYLDRPDKQYSLTDCISMQIMRARAIREVLTHDHHFEQEGFVPLLRE